MIATVKVLGLSARGAAAVAAAARRVVAYVEGGLASESAARAADYYADGAKATGHARGSGAALVGLHGPVAAEQLQRLLTGAHAVTGLPLLDGVGSAGRLDRGRRVIPPDQESFTLTEAARIAGVDVSYLRRLARLTAAADTVSPARPGRAEADGPARLRAERDPRSGRWQLSRAELLRFLARRQPPAVIIGYDVVCGAPKSLSVADAFADDELRADLAAALDAGVDAVFTYLERYAVQGMVDGRNRPGLGLAAASYRHEVSRADEAHLHIHNIIANALAIPLLDDDGHPERDPDGTARVQWRALDGEIFLQHVRTAGFVGAAAMRHELTRRRGVTWGPVRSGVAELAAFPAPLLAAFSTRHGQVHEEFAALVADGLFPDGRTQAAAQRRSRASKKVRADAEIRAIQTRRLTDAGWTPAQVRALLHRGDQPSQPPAPPTPQEITTLIDRLVGPQGLTANSPLFSRREVYQEVAAWAVDRLDSPSITDVVDEVMADPRIVLVHEQSPRRRRRAEQSFTTENLLDVEDSLLTLYRQGRVELGGAPHPLLPADAVDSALAAALSHTEGAGAIQLSDEQRGALRALLISADLIRPVVGPAGSGKTTVMRALARLLTTRGYTVLGATQGGRQAEQLADAVDIPTRVVSGWNTLLDTADDPTEHWPAARTVLIVDEATQISTRDAERLTRHATRTDTVMILVGDPAQLGSVGAGGWFPHLVEQYPPVALTAVHRQQGPAMRSVRAALSGLRSAVPTETMAALARLAADGHIHLFDDREALLAAAVTDWYSERTAAGTVAPMMAEHQRDVDALTVTARATLAADGTLTGPVLTAAGREFQTGDEVITLTQAGHTLVPEGRPKGRYIRTGTIGRVTAVHLDPTRPHAQTVTVHFPGKGTVRIGWDYLTYAFPDGRTGGLAHAYALTAHKAQGSTMPTARPLLADDTSRAGLYVMLSRAQRDLRGYLIRRADLDADLDEEDWLPILPTADAVDRLAEHLRTSRTDRLAADLDPHARAAHH
uniref:MobF family relaxase n=1 Tax=Frankia gtarii TaxID=2950102 RepID=UPI0021C0AEAA